MPALYIGLDVHKAKISVATADPGSKGEMRLHGEVAATLDEKTRRELKRGVTRGLGRASTGAS